MTGILSLCSGAPSVVHCSCVTTLGRWRKPGHSERNLFLSTVEKKSVSSKIGSGDPQGPQNLGHIS